MVADGPHDNEGSSATVEVRLRDPQGRVLGALALKPDSVGAVAGTFTKNRVAAAPVVLDRRRVQSGGTMRGVIFNAGNANAATGISLLVRKLDKSEVELNLKEGAIYPMVDEGVPVDG